jgi:hypothetical protein
MDGQHCVQDAEIRMLIQSQSFAMRLQKPSSLGSGQRIQILLHAEGEHALTVRYSMLATRMSVSGSAAFGSISNTSAAWQQLDNGTYAFYGLHILWDRPPSSDAELDLDADSSRFAAEKTFVLDFAADCHGAQPCAQDGDTFETVLGVATQSDQAELRSAVTFTAVVESLLSCEHSKVWVELDVRSVPQSSAIRVHLKAYDVDNLPVAQTRAEVEFHFDGQALPVQWSRGSHEYTADVPADLTENAGEYELNVTAVSGWTLSGGTVGCVLFRRSITVTSDAKQIVLASCLAALLVLSAAVFGFMLYRNRARAGEFLRSIFSLELFLVVEMCAEIWVRPLRIAMVGRSSASESLCRTLRETPFSSPPSAVTGTRNGWTRCFFRTQCSLRWLPWFHSCHSWLTGVSCCSGATRTAQPAPPVPWDRVGGTLSVECWCRRIPPCRS